MVAYLAAINASQSSETVREELQVGDSFDEGTRKRYEGLLEKKWTGIARLQRKVNLDALVTYIEKTRLLTGNTDNRFREQSQQSSSRA